MLLKVALFACQLAKVLGNVIYSYVPISIISAHFRLDTDICTEYYCSVLRTLGDRRFSASYLRLNAVRFQTKRHRGL